MKLWIVFCHEKFKKLGHENGRKNINFLHAIREIEDGDFLVINSPGKYHTEQKAFLIEIDNYPFVVPFNIRVSVIQLITVFPDRRYKNA